MLASLKGELEKVKSSEVYPRSTIEQLINCSTSQGPSWHHQPKLPRWASLEFYSVQYSRTAKLATNVPEFNQLSEDGKSQFRRIELCSVWEKSHIGVFVIFELGPNSKSL